jgi:xanthine/CO dehydrogenase XdhC/CoxF family maturation factor
VSQLGTDLQGWRSRGERIAFSILTDMLAVRYGRRGQPLSALGARGAPIHAGL